MKRVLFLVVFSLACVSHVASADDAVKRPAIRFNKDIRPILSVNCFACHGPDTGSRKADLRLDTRAGALAGKVIVPGKAGKSELIARITSDDPDFMMPPPKSRKKLTPEHKELLTRWVNAGAEWEKHWSFIKPRRAALPGPRRVKKWARNPIDHFVLARIRELGLEPNRQADRHTLARRVALDLTGLPPSREMIQSFLDDRKKGAYERYVDTLLSLRHAGEHRARYWLDAARYGDTHGMHVDNYREIWPYRDWVIDAFNSNMPFDRFIVEQIAGDLLPNATLQQRIATGFNRCNITTAEGGAIPEELLVRYMIDRVETTATVFMGLTAGCAVCHDHKYDPISQRDFYQLGAYFNNTTQPAMDGNQKDTPPVVTLPSAEYQEEWDQLKAERKNLRADLGRRDSGIARWWKSIKPQTEHPIGSDGLVLWLPLTQGEGDPLELPASAEWAREHPAGRRGIRFGNGGEISVAGPKLRSDQPLTLSFWIRTPDQLLGTTVFNQTAKNKEGKTVGWKVSCSTQGALTFEMHDGKGKSARGLLPGDEALTPRAWQHVCVRYSGGLSTSSITILVNGRLGRLRNATDSHIAANTLTDAPLKIATNLPTGGLSDLRIFKRWVSDEEVRLLGAEFVLKKLFTGKTAWKDLKRAERDTLTRYHGNVIDKQYQSVSRRLSATETRRDFIYARSTTTLVMQERSSQPRAWVLERGEYDQRRAEVAPGVPAVLPRLPGTGPNNRLALAKWLVHPDHPLTARVTVNRLWQSVFGVGLVKTSEDFGVMGERPSHPELLDWLAVEFVESGWNVKRLLKLIVTSTTYRQDSRVTSDELKVDSANRYLARGPRIRLDAEVLRDQILDVSGLLRRDIGGPSVRPYQPAGLWRVVAITGSNTRIFKRDSGDALYRRSVYTFWKRTSPPPSMAAFDAPTREQCTVRRERTNTPLQALVLMNDPQFVEAARHLAENTLKRHKKDRKRVEWMLFSVLCRPASKADRADALAAISEFRGVFEGKPKAAQALIETGDSKPDKSLNATEVAAWTLLANTLMNRDDFINK